MNQNVQVNVVDEIAQVNVNNQVVQNPYKLPTATKDILGGIKVGETLDIKPDGTLNAKGGSIDEVWEDIVPMITLDTATDRYTITMPADIRYKKIRLNVNTNVQELRAQDYGRLGLAVVINIDDPNLGCLIAVAGGSRWTELSMFQNPKGQGIINLELNQQGYDCTLRTHAEYPPDYVNSTADDITTKGSGRYWYENIPSITLLAYGMVSLPDAFPIGTTIKIEGVKL